MASRLQDFGARLLALYRARVDVIAVETADEDGVSRVVSSLCSKLGCAPSFWSAASGWRAGSAIESASLSLEEALNDVASCAKRTVAVLFDPFPWLQNPREQIASAGPVRKLRELVRSLPTLKLDLCKMVVLVGRDASLPADILDELPVLGLGLPDLDDLTKQVVAAHEAAKLDLVGVDISAIASAGLGLSGLAFGNAVAESITTHRAVRVADVFEAKKAGLKGSAVNWMEAPALASIDDGVAGLELVKAWIARRVKAWTPEARALGLELPKGILCTGIQGCGKSALARAVAGALGVPLVQLDLGSAYSKYLGDSEAQVKRSLETIDALGRCVVLADEVEKLLGGDGGEMNGSTSTRILQLILTWMQEKKSQAFIIATSNDISRLPPELMRKGRIDEIFWVDLPNRAERAAIFRLHLARRGLPVDLVTADLVTRTEGFSGAEIEAAVVAGRFSAFAEGCSLSLYHILEEIDATVPLSKTAADKLNSLRAYCRGRARAASKPDDEPGNCGRFDSLDAII